MARDRRTAGGEEEHRISNGHGMKMRLGKEKTGLNLEREHRDKVGRKRLVEGK